MEKDKNKMTERILNHTLQIIYLLTGEEYIIVKKNSPHSSIHLLTGEVPIKCDDVAVYFSVEEWEYLEGHKGLYKDVMMMENPKKLDTLEIPINRSSGFHNEKLDTVSISEQGEDETGEKDIQQVEIYPDTSAREIVSSGEEIEDLCVRSHLEAQENECHEDSSSGEIVSSEEQTEEPCVRGHLEAQEKEIHEDTSTGEYKTCVKNTGEVKVEIVQSVEQVEEPCVRTHLEAQEMEIHEDTHTGEVKIEIVRIVEQMEDPCVRSQLDAQEEEIHEDASTDVSMSRNMLEESNTTVYSSDGIAEDDTNMSYRFQGENSARNLPNKAKSCKKENITSTYMSYQYEQNVWALNEKCVRGSNDATCKTMKVRKQESRKCAEWFRKSVYEDHQVTHMGEQPPPDGSMSRSMLEEFHTAVCSSDRIMEDGISMSQGFQEEHFAINSTNESASWEQGNLPFLMPYVCPDCGKCFTCTETFITHQRTHTGEKPHKCNECGKHFSYKSCFIKHQRIHTKEKPFVCPECGKCFTQRSHLVTHQIIHTGVKPYVCHECGKCFTRIGSLIRHQRTHAGKNPHYGN
ncbi:hypothetical protein FKM82_007499 [Ascaphus truei]